VVPVSPSSAKGPKKVQNKRLSGKELDDMEAM
jgi:hypothetical protein